MGNMLTLAVLSLAFGTPSAKAVEPVRVHDEGFQTNSATWECTPGHIIQKRRITLDSGVRRYTFLISGCQDPSHEGKHPCAEGNFGMPEPINGNWYWGGFFRVFVNGLDATICDTRDLSVIEQGSRGQFQIIWSHPNAEVGLRLLLLPEGNHVLAHLVWRPVRGAVIESVKVQLTCYPSFFTAARNRNGERHCRTPRIDQQEPTTLELEPDADTYLYYYDAVFDVAKGEGDGPCAALVSPFGVRGGRVVIGSYAVQTELDLKPEVGEARLAFYDFAGLTNSQAEEYLTSHAAADLVELENTDFRPQAVSRMDLAAVQAEAFQLLADAADDGRALEPEVRILLAELEELKGQAQEGSWIAEAELAKRLRDSQDLFWKLRSFAVLNKP